ncbi:RNA polymerase subunit sigma-70 [Providencia rettgeri]
MNQSDFAKLHGVSRKTITIWKSRGWLVMDGDEIDVDASNEKIKRYRKSSSASEHKAKPKKTKRGQLSEPADESPTQTAERLIREMGANMSFDEARTMKENYLALLSQLDYDIKAGMVLPWQDMINKVGEEYHRMRTRLIAIAPEHGPRLRSLATTSSDAEFVTALQDIIHEAMEELSLDHSEQGG